MEPDTFAGLDLARFSGLDISRYRLVLRAVEPASLPAFLGSTLRGAFGHALKDAVCVMPHGNCARCMVMDRCLYPYLFETAPPEHASQLKGQQQAPHPFILTPDVAQAASLRSLRLPADAPPDFVPDVAQPASLRPVVAQVGNLCSSHVPADAFSEIALAGPCDGSRSRNGATGPSAQGPANLEVAQTVSLRPAAAQPASLRSSRVPSTAAVGASGPPRLLKHITQPPRVSRSPRPPFSPPLLSPLPQSQPERRIFLRPGDPISFDLVLLGRAIDYMPYIVYAVSEMARRGLGANRTRFELDGVTMLGLSAERPIYSGRTQRISTPPDARLPLSDLIRARLQIGSSHTQHSALSAHHCLLRFHTPARIRIEGNAQFSLSFDLLIRSLLRRLSLLAEVHGRGPLDLDYRGLIERAAQVRTRQSRLRWWDFERYSNRQRCKMKLGGFVGEIEYEGEAISEFLPLIAAGEILHVGSNTTFGLGLYDIVRNAVDATSIAGRLSRKGTGWSSVCAASGGEI
jgi:hypothetical protein